MKRTTLAVLVALFASLAAAGPAAAADEAVIDEVLAILKERGIVDEARYGELVAKNQAYETEQASLLSKIVWNGDFRGRLENYWYQQDDLGGEPDNRHRGRYRLRLGAVMPINEWVTAGFRLASGETENRSTNRSLGVGTDFDRDLIAIDEAYLQIKAPIELGNTSLTLGKQSNPFLWKVGKDYMTWDPDLSPEGLSLRWALQATSAVNLFANAGYFLVEERSGTKDPHFFGLQGGAHVQATEQIALGGRVTWFSWHSMNSGFFTRHNALGNVALSGASDSSFDQISVGGYTRASFSEEWPVLVHGHLTKNLDAGSIPGEGEQDLGWGVALEVGDAKKVALLGVGFYQLEADFSPALYIDSDVTDGFTNREGWAFYGARQIFPNTELNLTLFMSDALENGPAFSTSVAGSERFRLQSDVVVKF